MGKLLKKIIAKQFNADIEQYYLLPITQFGSCPQHCAINVVTTLVYRIQATWASGHAGALLLFDISSFFDNINPACAISILRNCGFPENVCHWATLFLSTQTATLKIGTYTSDPFQILTGMPQGSPLSLIVLALYTATLLKLAYAWTYCNLTLYVDDGAIYAMLATTSTATTSALEGFTQV
jgi:hypothetical protein